MAQRRRLSAQRRGILRNKSLRNLYQKSERTVVVARVGDAFLDGALGGGNGIGTVVGVLTLLALAADAEGRVAGAGRIARRGYESTIARRRRASERDRVARRY